MSAVAEILRSPQESQLSSFLQHAPVGLALCDIPGTITSASPEFEKLLGLKPSAIPYALPDLIEGDCDCARLLANLFRGVRENFQI